MVGQEKGGAESIRGLAGRYLTFALSKEAYGVQILKVQEIIGVMHITRVPGSGPAVRGVLNLRGKVIPVIDLRLKFGLKEAPYTDRTCIIVSEVRRGDSTHAVGVIVDSVLEVVNYSVEQLEPPPHYGNDIRTNFVLGIGRSSSNEVAVLVDIDAALAATPLPNNTSTTEPRAQA